MSSSSESSHSHNSLDLITFTGGPDEDVSIFLRDVKRVAIRQGELDDDDWIKHYIESCLSGTALYWFLELDDEALDSWRSIQRAFVRRFASKPAAPAPPVAQPAPAVPSQPAESTRYTRSSNPSTQPAPSPTVVPEPEPTAVPPEPKPEPEPEPIVPHPSPFHPTSHFQLPRDASPGHRYMTVGDSGVGKSCFFATLSGRGWIPSMMPTEGVDYFYQATGMYDRWDLSGADRFESLREQYYPYGDVITIAYDVTNRKSFENIRTWVRKIRRYNTKARLESVGYKCDLVDQIVVSVAEDHRLAKELGIHNSCRMSNKTGEYNFVTH